MVALVTLIALCGPLLAPHSPTEFVADPYDASSSVAWFGTDALGRDVFSRFLCGGLPVFLIALPATVIGVGAGAALGLFAAALRGSGGETIMRLLDVVLAFPQIVLALLFLTIIGPQPWMLVIVVAAAHAPQTARVIRGTAAEIVERDFVRAAETIGAPWTMIVLRDLLPNVSGQFLVEAGLRFTYSIAIVAALGFLGFGRPPPEPDWGLMISENKLGLTLAPWGALLPVIAIAMLTVGANLAIDALSRALARVGEARS